MGLRGLSAPLAAAAAVSALHAQAPPEVQGVRFDAPAALVWAPVDGASAYHVYRGRLSGLAAGVPGRCHGFRVPGTAFSTPVDPDSGEAFFYLVTGESATGVEGPAGTASSGAPRALLGSCAPVMRHHVLGRVGYGWDEWSRDRVASLGLRGYVDEQLDPASISEATNTTLANRLAPLTPPDDIVELIARQVVLGTYARRQLAQQAAAFWTNHFNTDWRKSADIFQGVFPRCETPPRPQCDPAFPARAYQVASSGQYREMNDFESLAFGGTFRQILETSALGAPMILYLDTFANIAGAPNENYARELLELHSMGVDGGFTQQDVEQLSRVFTGWTLCKKELARMHDPLAPCISNYWDPIPAGEWVATFVSSRHDCGQKILFQDTPQQIVIPSTCAVPASGVQDVQRALDAIAAHPSTARFISTKILRQFVADEPDAAMIDALVAVWNDPANPRGTGDLKAVLSAALRLPAFLDPDRARSKIKTPLEHFVSAFRATRGATDGITEIINHLVRAQQIPHYNPEPTGYPEDGAAWIDTNNLLERQNFGIRLAALNDPNFGSNPTGILNAAGISTFPGNAPAIVGFFADALFGGALTPAERQQAIDFLNTDDLGNPSSYNAARIRDTVGFLLGFPQFLEQ